MKNCLKEYKWNFLVRGLALLITGILRLACPTMAASSALIAVGVLVLICGIIDLLSYILNFGLPSVFKGNLIISVLEILFAILSFIRPELSSTLFTFASGILIITTALETCEKSILLGRAGFRLWPVSAVISVLVVFSGISLLFSNEHTLTIFAYVGSITLIIEGLELLFVFAEYVRSKMAFDKVKDSLKTEPESK